MFLMVYIIWDSIFDTKIQYRLLKELYTVFDRCKLILTLYSSQIQNHKLEITTREHISAKADQSCKFVILMVWYILNS